MVADEVYSHDGGEGRRSLQHGFIHDVNPTLLREDLEHGHECLEGKRKNQNMKQ
jgi:hypothetical protein